MVRMQQLDLVRLVSGELHFGCMRGALSDVTPVSVVLYEHRRQVLLGGCPQNGDMVACSKRHYGTVYDPHVIMSPDDVAKQCLLRQCLPNELAEQILPVRRPLQRAPPAITRVGHALTTTAVAQASTGSAAAVGPTCITASSLRARSAVLQATSGPSTNHARGGPLGAGRGRPAPGAR